MYRVVVVVYNNAFLVDCSSAVFIFNAHSHKFQTEGASYPVLKIDSCVMNLLVVHKRANIALGGVTSKGYCSSSGNLMWWWMVRSEYLLKNWPQQNQLEGSPYPMLGIDDNGTSFMLSDEITKIHPRGNNIEKIFKFKLLVFHRRVTRKSCKTTIIEYKMRIQYKILLAKYNEYKTSSKLSICGGNMLLAFTWCHGMILYLCFVSVFPHWEHDKLV